MGGLSTQCGGVGRPCGRLLSGGRFRHLIGQTGAAGAGHGRRATAGTVKITQGQETSLALLGQFLYSLLKQVKSISQKILN